MHDNTLRQMHTVHNLSIRSAKFKLNNSNATHWFWQVQVFAENSTAATVRPVRMHFLAKIPSRGVIKNKASDLAYPFD